MTPPATSTPVMTETTSTPVVVSGKSQILAHTVGASEEGENFELEFTPDTSEESLPLVPAIGEDGGGVRRATATADEMSFEHRVPGSTPDISEHKVDGRQSNGRKQDDMKRSAFLDPSFVKTHLRTFVHGSDNLKKYCTSNGVISNYNALRKYANEINIIQLKDYGSDIDVEPLLDGLFEKKME